MTSNLSRYRWHSFLPQREFDQQSGLFFCPFAGLCRLHCCLCSTRTIAISLFLKGWDYRSPLLGRGVRALEQLYSYAVTGPYLCAPNRSDEFAA